MEVLVADIANMAAYCWDSASWRVSWTVAGLGRGGGFEERDDGVGWWGEWRMERGRNRPAFPGAMGVLVCGLGEGEGVLGRCGEVRGGRVGLAKRVDAWSVVTLREVEVPSWLPFTRLQGHDKDVYIITHPPLPTLYLRSPSALVMDSENALRDIMASSKFQSCLRRCRTHLDSPTEAEGVACGRGGGRGLPLV